MNITLSYPPSNNPNTEFKSDCQTDLLVFLQLIMLTTLNIFHPRESPLFFHIEILDINCDMAAWGPWVKHYLTLRRLIVYVYLLFLILLVQFMETQINFKDPLVRLDRLDLVSYFSYKIKTYLWTCKGDTLFCYSCAR